LINCIIYGSFGQWIYVVCFRVEEFGVSYMHYADTRTFTTGIGNHGFVIEKKPEFNNPK